MVKLLGCISPVKEMNRFGDQVRKKSDAILGLFGPLSDSFGQNGTEPDTLAVLRGFS